MVSEPGMLWESRGKHKKQHEGTSLSLTLIASWYGIITGLSAAGAIPTNQKGVPNSRCSSLRNFYTLYRNSPFKFLGQFCNMRSSRPSCGPHKRYKYSIWKKQGCAGFDWECAKIVGSVQEAAKWFVVYVCRLWNKSEIDCVVFGCHSSIFASCKFLVCALQDVW